MKKLMDENKQLKAEFQPKIAPLKKTAQALEEKIYIEETKLNKLITTNKTNEKTLPKATAAASTPAKPTTSSSTTTKPTTSSTTSAAASTTKPSTTASTTSAASTAKTPTTPSTPAKTGSTTTPAVGEREYYAETDKIAKLFIPGERDKIQISEIEAQITALKVDEKAKQVEVTAAEKEYNEVVKKVGVFE
jgi:hypothetical protein